MKMSFRMDFLIFHYIKKRYFTLIVNMKNNNNVIIKDNIIEYVYNQMYIIELLRN